MNKKFIIRNNREFTFIIENKQKIQNNYFVIYFLDKKEELNRYGISVGKKVGKAVIRNKLKRQIKNIINKDKKNYEKSKDCIIICKKSCLELNYSEIENNLKSLLMKIK